MRCGSCNEVFDGNAALLEPLAIPPAVAPVAPVISPAPPPPPASFDEVLAVPDTRANGEPIYTLELDSAMDEADDGRFGQPVAGAAQEQAAADGLDSGPAAPAWRSEPEPGIAPGPVRQSALESALEPAAVPDTEPGQEPGFEHEAEPEPVAEPGPELEAEPEPESEPESEPEPEPGTEPDAGPEVEPEVEPEPASGQTSEPAADERPAAIEPAPEDPLAIKPMTHEELEAALAAELALMEQSIAAEAAEEEARSAPSDSAAARREPTLDPDSRYDLDEADEEALVQLAAARERDAAPAIHTLLRAASAPSQDRFEAQVHSVQPAEAAVEEEEVDDPNEPGFLKRERRRERYGKSITIAMGVGSLLLVGALAAQGLTTFRNQLAASYPALKPTLQDLCATLGCKIELPTQIDELVIEQGELQTLSETTFSFTTLLRNQSTTAQQWPHIELVLDDANDKAILRRVFTPRDYLGADAALEQGFAPRSEQSVKLYFELKQLKASGYHIAVFYP